MGAVAAPLLTAGTAAAAPAPSAPVFVRSPDTGGAPPVQGLHLTFGKDPATQMVVSWLTDGPVRRPRVLYGTLGHGLGSTSQARTRTYRDGKSGRTVYVHHCCRGCRRTRTTCIWCRTTGPRRTAAPSGPRRAAAVR